MNLLQLGIGVLLNILAQYKKAGALPGVLAGIQGAIDSLRNAHDEEVTEGELEGLRVSIPDWK